MEQNDEIKQIIKICSILLSNYGLSCLDYIWALMKPSIAVLFHKVSKVSDAASTFLSTNFM